MLTLLARLLKALNSEAAPWQIAIALSMSLFVALTPMMSWHNLIVLLLVLVIKINLSGFIFGVLVFSGLGWLFDPYISQLGAAILTNPDWQPFWQGLYNNDFWRITRFNHTLVMGGITAALVAFVPVFFISKMLVNQYRAKLLVWVEKLWIAKFIKGSKFYRIYQNFAG